MIIKFLRFRSIPSVTGRRLCSSCQQGNAAVLKAVPGRYNDLHIDVNASISSDTFYYNLSGSLDAWRCEGVSAVWLRIPILKSELIKPTAQLGFRYHHAQGDYCVLSLWLPHDKSNKLHHFAFHRVGAGGFVLNEEKREVLLVKDKSFPDLWKFPGGLSDFGEDIGECAVREVREETGVESAFQSVLSFRQQHRLPGAFGASDLYAVCRLQPLSDQIRACPDEILECEWVPLDRVLMLPSENASHFTKRLVTVVQHGLAHGFHTVDMTGQQLESVYRGKYFNIYHRPLTSPHAPP